MATTSGIRFLSLFVLSCVLAATMQAQDWENIQLHGFATQGFLYSSKNNYLGMNSSAGSLQWTDGAVSVTDSVTDKLRVGIQLHMYQMGQFGGPQVQIDWASGDYKVNDHFGVRAGKIKTVLGLFNDSQDVEPVFLWILLPQTTYPIDNRSFMLSELGGAVYGDFELGKSGGHLRYIFHGGDSTLDSNQGYAQQLAEAGLNFANAPHCSTYGSDFRWLTPVRGLMVGASGLAQNMEGLATNGSVNLPFFFVPAFYAQFQRGKWFFAGEYWRAPVDMEITIGPVTFPFLIDQRSWYAMASYHLFRRAQVGTYYSHYLNKAYNNSDPANYSKDWVISGRYDFNAYFYGKLEGHFLHGDGLGYYTGVNPNGLAPNANMLAAKIGFTF